MSQPRPVDLDALSDLATPWCLRVVTTLGVADHLAAGVTKLDELAAATHADARSLDAVLAHLVDKGVFEQPAPGEYALNDAARQLREPGWRLGLGLDGIGGRMTHVWSGLLDAVRTGRIPYEGIFGRPFWADLDANPDVAESFDALMGPGHGTPDPDLGLADGWESVRTVVDVGGGTGGLLAEILRAWPGIRGTLVDLPRTVARSGEVFATAGVTDRVTAVGQSFFDPLPAGADLYLLKSVLSDWPDEPAVALLRRCAEAARPDGRVIVLNGVSPDSTYPDLLMLVLVGGRQRTLAEFTELAWEAGLAVAAAGWQPSGRYVVECRPV
jgi:2,7-dihydroxy-5-methyl-1-naphthoate 7-O-methyltransferase